MEMYVKTYKEIGTTSFLRELDLTTQEKIAVQDMILAEFNWETPDIDEANRLIDEDKEFCKKVCDKLGKPEVYAFWYGN
jgi:hypothetical protein